MPREFQSKEAEMTTQPQPTRLGPLQYGIIALVFATAFIHLFLATLDLGTLRVLFALNGLGYLALVGGLYLPLPVLAPYRNAILWLLVAYATVTIVLWWVMNGDFTDPLGVANKAIEVVLILLLVLEARRQP
jgi:hypothetical protein